MTDSLDFGVMLSATSNSYGLPDEELPGVFRRFARTAEETGFDALVAGDHVVYPDEIPTDYEFSSTGEPPFDTTTSLFDVFQVLSHLASVTETITLGTHVVAVPYRHPLVLTKNVLTTEALSEGRFDFGVAPGWLKTEFDALEIPFDERGSRTDEFLEIFEAACAEGVTGYDGEHYSFDEVGFYPSPDREIPIWMGGKSSATFRRVAEFGDGWATLWDHPDDVEQALERIMNAWSDYDRDGEPEVSVLRPVNLGEEADPDRLLSGPAESVREDVQAYRDAGVTRLVVDFFTTDVDEQVALMEEFGETVIDEF